MLNVDDYMFIEYLKYSMLMIIYTFLRSQAHKVGYIFRPWRKPNSNSEKLRLSGYGVELQFKSQEYKAQDDSSINKPGV